MLVTEIKKLLEQEIDFKAAARKIREFQIEECSADSAWEIFYDKHGADPKLHYGPHLDKLVAAGEDHDSLSDAFDIVFYDLLTEALKKIQLKIVEED